MVITKGRFASILSYFVFLKDASFEQTLSK
jgi:hypothetical protein